MIRVVPVEYFIEDTPDRPSHLAFLSTVTDNFISFDGCQVWDSWADLAEYADEEFLERVQGLCPAWFFSEEELQAS